MCNITLVYKMTQEQQEDWPTILDSVPEKLRQKFRVFQLSKSGTRHVEVYNMNCLMWYLWLARPIQPSTVDYLLAN